MKPICQLLRRPGKTILGVILVALAGVLLCVSLGQYYAGRQMEARIQKEYTTVALPTGKYKSQEVLDENGNKIGMRYLSSQPPEVSSFLGSLAERYPSIVEGVRQHGFVSGYCQSLTPVNYMDTAISAWGDGLTGLDNAPYTCAVLEISIEEISPLRPYMTEDLIWGDENPEDYGVAIDVKGTVLEACALAPGYENPTGRTIQIELRVENEEAFDALGLEIGKKYLVYGADYRDLDWELRQRIAGGDQAVFDGFSWDNLQMLSDSQRAIINKDNELDGIEEDYVAQYQTSINEEEFGYFLNETDLLSVDSCRLTVCPNPSVAQGFLTQEEVLSVGPGGLNMISQEEYAQKYRQAGIRPADSAVSDDVWETAQTTAQVNNHAFPVMTTGNLQSVVPFALEEARITAGRSFTQEEYESGSRLCVLSESLAVENGLTVGDTITIQFYETDLNLPGQSYLKTANPTPGYYSPNMGFSGEGITYEIVGLYRQSNQWSVYDYSFTPNTIFVPEGSTGCQPQTSDSGVFCTIVLKNGTSEKMDQELEKAGYPGLLSYYDQGYSKIEGSLKSYFGLGKTILLIGIISFLVFIGAFLILFPLHQKKDAMRMWSLGAPEKQITSFILGSGMGILLPGTVLAGCASLFLLQYVQRYMEDYAGILGKLRLPWLFVVLVAVAQAVFVGVLLYMTAKIMAKRLKKG